MGIGNELRTVGDKYSALPLDSVKRLYLFEEALQVDHDPVAQQVQTFVMEDAAGQLVEGVLFALVDNGVSCVVAPVEPSAESHLPGEKVD